MRAPDVSFEYEVRTPRLYWAVAFLLALAALWGARTLFFALAFGIPSLRLLVPLTLALAPVLYLIGTREYRASGRIRVTREAIEVPGARGGTLRFPIDARLAVRVIPVHVRVTLMSIPLGDVPRGFVIDLQRLGVRRRISTLTLVDPREQHALVRAIEHVTLGTPLEDEPREIPPAPDGTPRDRYDEQIDRELRDL